MRKIGSILISLIMIFSMISVTAAENTKMQIVQVGPRTGRPVANPYDSGGLGGKAATEYSYKIEGTKANQNLVIKGKTKTGDYSMADSKYVVVDVNILPTTPDTVVACGPDIAAYTITSTADKLKTGKWNSVRVVIECKSEEDIIATQKYQKMTMYINGEKIDSTDMAVHAQDVLHTPKAGPQTCANGFRVTMMAKDGPTVVYAADIRLSESDVDEAPSISHADDTQSYYVNNDLLIMKERLTLESVKSQLGGYGVKLFADNTLSQEITDKSAYLKDFNVLVVTDGESYSYYDVFEREYIYNCDMSDGLVQNYVLSAGGWNCEKGKNFAGKNNDWFITASGSADTYFRLNYDSDRGVQGNQPMSADSAKYVVLSFDMVPDRETKSDFSIATAQENVVVPKSIFDDELSVSRWNNITLVIKNNAADGNQSVVGNIYADIAQAQAASPHKYDLFIGGDLIVTDETPGAFGMIYTVDGTETVGDMFDIIAGSSVEKTCQFDNIRLYELNDYDVDTFMDFPSIVSAGTKAALNGSQIILNDAAGVEAKDIIVADGCSFELYDKYMNKKTESVAKSGDTVVVTDGFNIKNYIVINPVTAVVTRGNTSVNIDYVNTTSGDVNPVAVVSAWSAQKPVGKKIVSEVVGASSAKNGIVIDFGEYIDAAYDVEISVWQYDSVNDSYTLLSEEIY